MSKQLFVLSIFILVGNIFGSTIIYKMDADVNKDKFSVGKSQLYNKDSYQGKNSYFIKGRNYLLSPKILKIKPNEKYKASLYVKALGNMPSIIYAGWVCYNNDGKVIPSNAFHSVKNTITSVIETCKIGSKIIKVKDASKWKKGTIYCIAINAKKDNSDLPNYLTYPIDKIENVNNEWQIVLKNPTTVNISKETLVREHIKGGDFLFCSGKIIYPSEWEKIESIWYWGKEIRKAEAIQFVIITNLGKEFNYGQILIDNLTLKIQKGNIEF